MGIAAHEEEKAGLGLAVHQAGGPPEAQHPRLVGAAGGGAAGDVDLGQGTVGDIGLAHRVHAGMEQGLGVPHAHLAGGAADAAHRGLEQGLCPVGGESQNFLGLGAGEVDNIGRLVGGQAHLGPVHVRQGVAEGAQGVQVGLAADGVPGHGVQAGLLLRNDPGPGHRHAVPLLGDRGRGQVQVQVHLRGEHRVQLLLIGPGVALRPAADVLHIAGAGLALPPAWTFPVP